jgi:hypothetical protein
VAVGVVRKCRKRSDETAAPAECPVKRIWPIARLWSAAYFFTWLLTSGARALAALRKPVCTKRGCPGRVLMAYPSQFSKFRGL